MPQLAIHKQILNICELASQAIPFWVVNAARQSQSQLIIENNYVLQKQLNDIINGATQLLNDHFADTISQGGRVDFSGFDGGKASQLLGLDQQDVVFELQPTTTRLPNNGPQADPLAELGDYLNGLDVNNLATADPMVSFMQEKGVPKNAIEDILFDYDQEKGFEITGEKKQKLRDLLSTTLQTGSGSGPNNPLPLLKDHLKTCFQDPNCNFVRIINDQGHSTSVIKITNNRFVYLDSNAGRLEECDDDFAPIQFSSPTAYVTKARVSDDIAKLENCKFIKLNSDSDIPAESMLKDYELTKLVANFTVFSAEKRVLQQKSGDTSNVDGKIATAKQVLIEYLSRKNLNGNEIVNRAIEPATGIVKFEKLAEVLSSAVALASVTSSLSSPSSSSSSSSSSYSARLPSIQDSPSPVVTQMTRETKKYARSELWQLGLQVNCNRQNDGGFENTLLELGEYLTDCGFNADVLFKKYVKKEGVRLKKLADYLDELSSANVTASSESMSVKSMPHRAPFSPSPTLYNKNNYVQEENLESSLQFGMDNNGSEAPNSLLLSPELDVDNTSEYDNSNESDESDENDEAAALVLVADENSNAATRNTRSSTQSDSSLFNIVSSFFSCCSARPGRQRQTEEQRTAATNNALGSS